MKMDKKTVADVLFLIATLVVALLAAAGLIWLRGGGAFAMLAYAHFALGGL